MKTSTGRWLRRQATGWFPLGSEVCSKSHHLLSLSLGKEIALINNHVFLFLFIFEILLVCLRYNILTVIAK